jgi:UPF0755 protein
MLKVLMRILAAILVLALLAGGYFYYKVLDPKVIANNEPGVFIEIPHGSSFADVEAQLKDKGLLEDPATFQLLAQRMGYVRNPMRSGRFEIKPGTTVLDLIRQLRNGPQAPVNVILTTEREPENIAAKAARFIEPDSLQLVTLFQNENYLDSIGFTKETLMTLFIPNSYEFFWNTGPRGFVARMIKENSLFWSKDQRSQKAEKLGLSHQEVYTLASIVEKETLRNDEKKRMAGVYYNRLQIGMPLQADPTAVFASRDFATPRVTNYHLGIDSPYNTYKYAGLPPGPIAMPAISSIDAVLNLETHDYLYFCAVGDGSGYHNFAQTLPAHNRNAAIYRDNLAKRGKR